MLTGEESHYKASCSFSSQNGTPQCSLHRNLELPLKRATPKQSKGHSLEEDMELTGVAQIWKFNKWVESPGR